MEQLPSVGNWKKEMRGRKLKHTSSERKLDYNAPLLSVRRFNKEGGGGGGGGGASGKRGIPISSKLWKLSSELSAEPLRAAGAVPFDWEHSPGRPKQSKEEEEEEEEEQEEQEEEEEVDKKSVFFAAASRLDDDDDHRQHHPMEEAEIDSISPIPSSPRAPMAVQQHKHSNGAAIYATVYSYDSSSSPSSSTTARDADDDVSIPPTTRLTTKRSSPIVVEIISASVLNSPAPQYHLEQEKQKEKEKDYSFSEAAETLAATTTTAGFRVSLDGGRELGEEEKPLSHTGSDAREFIMNRFLPAAQAIASDAPQAGATARRQRATANNRVTPPGMPRTPRQSAPLRGGGGGGGRGGRVVEEVEEEGGSSMKACGFFSLKLKNAFGHINRARPPPQSGGAKQKGAPSPLSRRQEEVIYEDSSTGTDEEEAVVREVKATLQQRRSRALEHLHTPPISPRQPATSSIASSSPKLGGSFRGSDHNHHQLIPQHSLGSEADEPRFYDAPSRFGPQTPDRSSSGCVTPYRNGTPMSPFHEGRGFLGLPKESSNDGGGSRFETPRASVDSKSPVDMDFCTNGGISDANILSKAPKPSGLSKRFGKALWVDTGDNHDDDEAPGMHDMNGFGINYYTSRGAAAAPAPAAESSEHLNELLLHHRRRLHQQQQQQQQQQLQHQHQLQQQESNNSRLASPSSIGPVPGIFPANYQPNPSENKGWPLGISSYFSAESSPCISPTQQKSAQKFSPLHVPSPPLPPSPSGSSWLSKAVSSNVSNPSPLSALRTTNSTTKKKLEFSPTKAAAGGGGGAKWENMVKGSHVQPGHLRFSEELLHHSSNSLNANKP